MIKTDITGVLPFLQGGGLDAELERKLDAAHRRLKAGGEFTGWLHLPSRIDEAELKRLEAAAAKIRGDSEVLLVIGLAALIWSQGGDGFAGAKL
jgi:glucose-6-phosphate isomerase